jgi:hypothetical protein
MGAKESSEMKKARDLIINNNMSVCAAAKDAGITYAAIYMSRWYKEWKKAKNKVANK